ncbi:hypothetical protein ES702_06471 [subsurface metagenome]
MLWWRERGSAVDVMLDQIVIVAVLCEAGRNGRDAISRTVFVSCIMDPLRAFLRCSAGMLAPGQ